ncbi:hypothetical protein Smp_076550 [Schistosoma mansoni]|uniref:hypothetical protein n=1 Tax=Schistosoma mansoni TaxID=6183 RepID=UPI0001A61DD8|nr:hypothetical protein Smp_076550 [Schistosoma mansoni]|eukprot:XP_018646634.1 hypothetical protein Smp_076550 [Schistosoma mansoni]
MAVIVKKPPDYIILGEFVRDSPSPLIVADNGSKTDDTQIANQDYVSIRTPFNTKDNLNKNDVAECDIPVKK